METKGYIILYNMVHFDQCCQGDPPSRGLLLKHKTLTSLTAPAVSLIKRE